jgi:hypothetical protein
MRGGLSTHLRRDGGGWKTLLLVPLLVLITPLYNRDAPRLLGFPVFYWLPALFVPLSVVCVALVCHKTKDTSPEREPDITAGAPR